MEPKAHEAANKEYEPGVALLEGVGNQHRDHGKQAK
jgi:hypothetical protein